MPKGRPIQDAFGTFSGHVQESTRMSSEQPQDEYSEEYKIVQYEVLRASWRRSVDRIYRTPL
ncbi:hypothetical protein EAI_03079 [Harpegnathos saltator]|uniref:Uncharacterized protein n=1 Tax=Harpegnathos saltator TaxID=610380 RepID=E2BCU6_HARSA|nr:hypothetical protein EAI_03079 [Harpegnathos saltator]